MNKYVLLAGGVGVLSVLGILIYFLSTRKTKQGVEYDLSPAGEMFSLDPTGNAQTTTTGTANAPPVSQNVLNPNTEPAKSLIAKRSEQIYLSPNTMDDVRQRYGSGTALFMGVDTDSQTSIKREFAAKFGINGDSYMSYPLWTPTENPTLLQRLQQAKNYPSYDVAKKDAKQSGKGWAYFTNIPEWNVNFATFLNKGAEGAPSPQQWNSLVQFLKNAATIIENIQKGVTVEAIQSLRRQGYKFEGYDLNPIS